MSIQIIALTDSGDLRTVYIDPTDVVENLKALLEVETGIPLLEMGVLYEGRELRNDDTLTAVGLQDGAMVTIQRRAAPRQAPPASAAPRLPTAPLVPQPGRLTMAALDNAFSSAFAALAAAPAGAAPGRAPPASVPPRAASAAPRAAPPPTAKFSIDDVNSFFDAGVRTSDLITQAPPKIRLGTHEFTPTTLISHAKQEPEFLEMISTQNPPLANAILTDDVETVTAMMREIAARQRRELARDMALALNPDDPELQREMEEEIRRRRVHENYEHAVEHNPEVFGRVVMLYVDCEVNKTPLKAFIDSGAQMTIMSKACAERCGIMRLVDTRFAGMASGVGTARIMGKVHAAPIKIGGSFFLSSFTILEEQSLDFLLGLDMLRKHQANIDLNAGCLRIGDEMAPFLAEKDLPLSQRDAAAEDPAAMDTDAGPGPASTTTTTSSTTLPPGARDVAVSDEVLAGLMALGFDRDQSLAALQQAGGSAEVAAAILMRSLDR